MKVAQFTDSYVPIIDGVGRVVYNYSELLNKKGCECHVITSQNIFDKPQNDFTTITYHGIKLKKPLSYNVGVPIFDFGYLHQMSKTKFDLVHAHSPFSAGMEAFRYAKVRNLPLISTFHSRYYDDFYSVTKSKAIAEIGVKTIIAFYNTCDEIWTVSHYAAETLKSYGYRGNITVIPNGTESVDDDCAVSIVDKEYSLGDEVIFLYVGQVNLKKNILTSMQALSLLKKQGYNFKFLIVGSGPDKEKLETSAKELGITDNIIFIHHIYDKKMLNAIYKRADLFIFPSLYDTAGLVVQEAASMGTASAVLSNTGPSENVVNGFNGILSINSPQALSESIRIYMDDRDAFGMLGENAKNTIPQSWDSIIDRVMSEYERIIEESKHKNR